jgi:predicted chitinase
MAVTEQSRPDVLVERKGGRRRPPKIGWRSLRYVCPNLSRKDAKRIAAGLALAFERYDVTTRRRAAAAVAQMAHESDRFRASTEYADGRAYEGRRDLGNVRPGDGPRFRGRGRIMITGRANYAAVSKAFGEDFTAHPERLAQSPLSELVSCWWWKTHGCNELADSGDFVALTRRINGGTNGLSDRIELHHRAKRVARWLVPKP